LKVTVPVGDWPVTVAVQVTAAPYVEGYRLEPTVVVVLATFTVCVSAVDVLAALFVSPA
jgi:hypothetical protein